MTFRPFDDPNSINGGGNNGDIGAFEFHGTPPVVLANISGRLPVGTGDNALFAGFIVTGYQPKKVIIRAIGPSLGVAGGLADPTLELRDGSGALLQSNDNWKDSPNKQAIIDSTIPPTNDLESAIVATLPANASYTAIVRGVGNGTGIGVVEVYDLDRTVDSKLANISTRGLVQTGDNVLIAGTIVVGQTSEKVIIRALGPSTGVPGAMADPTLELHDSNGALLEANDNWMDSPNKQAIIDSTVPPSNPLESAIVRSVAPGNYTAIVRGVNNGTGTGVVEVYDLDTSANSKLANISSRGLVETGDNVLIAGTIVVGQTSEKVIIRALGPSTGVPGAMADPTLELRDANGNLLEANDNWVDSPNKQAIIDSTIPPPNNVESAIVRTLTPANYTAIVRGVNNTTGIAVVEVYALN